MINIWHVAKRFLPKLDDTFGRRLLFFTSIARRPGTGRAVLTTLIEQPLTPFVAGRPLICTIAYILGFPSVSQIDVPKSSGNTPELSDAKPAWPPQNTLGLLSCCR
jgi:hypothetical protein